MTRPTTRSKNANQHPGQIVIEGKQKRRTSEQKQADDAQAEHARQEQAAARERGIKRIANIIERNEQDAGKVLTDPPKPRVRLVVKPPTAEPSETAATVLESQEITDDAEMDEDEETSDQQGETDNEELTQKAPKRQRTQKTHTREAVEAARGISDHSHGVSSVDSRDQYTDTAEKPQKGNSSAEAAAKADFAGTGGVKDWADKLASSKSLNPLLSQRSIASSSRHTQSVSSTRTASQVKAPSTTPASTHASSTQPSTPLGDGAATEPQESPADYIDSEGNDQVEYNSIPNASAKPNARRTNIMDVTEVVSTSESDEKLPNPPPPSRADSKNEGTTGQASRTTNVKQRRKRGQEDQVNTEDGQSGAPASKRSKKAGISQRSGSGANKKYIKDDLPLGSTTDNIWRRLFISALAHFAAGYNDPWLVSNDKFTSVLQIIWDTVYQGKIEHSVTANGPVYHIAKQSLNNWRGGFASAAVAIITTFFANDSDFLDAQQRSAFANAMLKKNRFLFSQNRGEDNKSWSGLWRSLLILQTFAHHFNFIQGRAEVPALVHELSGPRAALALACAAVCRTLTLVANNKISFKQTESKLGKVWTANIEKGSQYEFNETVWGVATRRYLDPIKELSDENFSLIVEDTLKYVKKGTVMSTSVDSGDEDSEYEDLFAFR